MGAKGMTPMEKFRFDSFEIEDKDIAQPFLDPEIDIKMVKRKLKESN
jgi:hypothetical protein